MTSTSTSTNPPADERSAELETPHHDTSLHNSNNNSASKGFDHRGDNSKSGFDYRHDGAGAADDDSVGKNAGVEMGYLPPDQRANIPGELFSTLVDPDIADDTEAAEALRANAGVKVGKVGKAARSLNAQSVRKLAKRVTMRGYRRGKPPRIPPGMANANAGAGGEIFMYPLSEEDEMALNGQEDGSSQSSEPSRDIQPPPSDDKRVTPPAAKDHSPLAPLGVKESHLKDEGSYVSPSHGGETDPSRMKGTNRHSSILEEAKDIPAEVVAATMEAGRKCKFLAPCSLLLAAYSTSIRIRIRIRIHIRIV
jgi:hypothetical protein